MRISGRPRSIPVCMGTTYTERHNGVVSRRSSGSTASAHCNGLTLAVLSTITTIAGSSTPGGCMKGFLAAA